MRSLPIAPLAQQKEFWASKFQDVGWVAPRLIAGMATSDYFYCREIVQVRTDTWYRGRVVLVADAAHCPSPMTGMGTTSALVGAYVLAGEIAHNAGDLGVAFANYDRTLRPFLGELQRLPGWVFPLIMPKARLGLVAWLRIPQLVARFAGEERGGWVVPEYALLNESMAKRGEGELLGLRGKELG
ncbi:hypothetical protein MMC13_005427 [Lambiella insularis]|nr:hypothetical protein [Lambiella insularis]